MREQGIQRLRHVRLQRPQRVFARVVAALQVEVHRVADQRRVLDVPRFRLLAQQQIGPGPCLEIAQAGVDAVHVGLQQRALRAGDAVEMGRRARAQAVHATALVGVDGDGAEQFGELAGGGATQQVHLEEAFLRMHVAQRTHRIGFAAGIDADRADGIALDRGCGGQARQCDIPVEGCQAGTHGPPDGERDDQQRDQQQRDTAPEPLQHRAIPQRRGAANIGAECGLPRLRASLLRSGCGNRARPARDAGPAHAATTARPG